MKSALNNLTIVLVETTHPGNIGAAARAMMTMGLAQLILVSPKCDHLAKDAIAMASGAEAILQSAILVDTLSEALSDAHFTVATSARLRSLPWPLLTPTEMAQEITPKLAVAKVAVVFGRESSGLTNAELQQCQQHMTIPTSQEHHSLNLAQAVQIVAYECAKHDLSVESTSQTRQPASQGEFDGFIAHLESTLTQIQFLNPQHPKLLMGRLRRLFLRASPDEREINILRGILSTIEKKLRH